VKLNILHQTHFDNQNQAFYASQKYKGEKEKLDKNVFVFDCVHTQRGILCIALHVIVFHIRLKYQLMK